MEQISEKALSAVSENGNSLQHTIGDVEVALRLLAYNGGNASRTCRELKVRADLDIHPNTLRGWQQNHFPEKYATIQREMADEIGERVGGIVTDLAIQGAEIQGQMLTKLEDKLKETENVELKDLTNGVRSLAQSTETNVRNRQLLFNKPTSIVENRNIEEALDYFEELGIIDSTAEEVED